MAMPLLSPAEAHIALSLDILPLVLEFLFLAGMREEEVWLICSSFHSCDLNFIPRDFRAQIFGPYPEHLLQVQDLNSNANLENKNKNCSVWSQHPLPETGRWSGPAS